MADGASADERSHSLAAMWRVIAGPCPLDEQGMHAMGIALARGAEAGALVATPDSQAASDPLDVADAILGAVSHGERVLLANGPWQLGSTLGDPYLGRAVAALPRDLPSGVVVGGFHHAHALTGLALGSPMLDTYVAAPVTESLAAVDGHGHALRAFREMELLGTPGESLLRTPRRAHVGYARAPGRRRPIGLPACVEVKPRALIPGEARGPLLAGSLLPLSFEVARWSAALDGAILAVEIAGAQIRMIDRYMQRLALTGIFDRIGALLVGAPFDVVPEKPSLELDLVIRRAVGRSGCVTVADAFVGCGVPATQLKLAAPVTVSADTAGVTLTPCQTTRSASGGVRS